MQPLSSLSLSDGAIHPVYQHTPALPPAPYHKPKYEPVVYEEEYPKQNCSVVDETIKVIHISFTKKHHRIGCWLRELTSQGQLTT